MTYGDGWLPTLNKHSMNEAPERGGMFGHSGSIRRIAERALERCAAGIDDLSNDHESDALVAIVFAAATLEAWINDLEALLAVISKQSWVPPNAVACGEWLSDLEDSNARTSLKYQVAAYALSGQVWKRGAEPLQGLHDLFLLRNSIMHTKPLDAFVRVDESPGFIFQPAKLLARFSSRDIVSIENPQLAMSWTSRIGTPAAARWAIGVVDEVTHAFVDPIPSGQFKLFIESLLHAVERGVRKSYIDATVKNSGT
jgi:hypothetical protein